MYCKKCGSQISEDAVFCPKCGAMQGEEQPKQEYQQPPKQEPIINSDIPNVVWLVLGIFFPLIGLILYLVWKDTEPEKAKQSGKGALIGVGISIASVVVYYIFIVSLIGGLMI